MAQTQPVKKGPTVGEQQDENLAIATLNNYDDTTATIIDAHNLTKGMITILSYHASNSIRYKIRGSIKSGSTAPADNDKSWVTVIAETVVAANQTEPVKEAWSEPYAWIRVDVMSDSSGNPGTADVRSRGVTI